MLDMMHWFYLLSLESTLTLCFRCLLRIGLILAVFPTHKHSEDSCQVKLPCLFILMCMSNKFNFTVKYNIEIQPGFNMCISKHYNNRDLTLMIIVNHWLIFKCSM